MAMRDLKCAVQAPIFLLCAGICCALSLGAAHAQGACLRDTAWGKNIAPHAQKMEFDIIARKDDAAIVGIRFGPMTGDFAKVFGFFLYRGDCVTRAFVIGASAASNGSRSIDDLPEGEAPYFTSDYYSVVAHATLNIFKEPPTYEEARDLAMEYLR